MNDPYGIATETNARTSEAGTPVSGTDVDETLTPEQVLDQIRTRAAGHDLYVFETTPAIVVGVSVGCPADTPEDFVDLAQQLGVKVIYTELQYLDPDVEDDSDSEGPDARGDTDESSEPERANGVAAMFALEGIQHWYHHFPYPDPDSVGAGDQGGSAVRVRVTRDEGDDDFWHRGTDDDHLYMYYSAEAVKPLSDELRTYVDEVVNRPDFDLTDRRGRDTEALDAAVAHLAPEDEVMVRNVLSRVFHHKVGNILDTEAATIAQDIVKNDGYHPLMGRDELADLVTTVLAANPPADLDPRVAIRVPRQTERLGWDRGLQEKAHRAARRRATALLDELPDDVRDQVGFASRAAAREALLEPYLENENKYERSAISSEMKDVEAEKYLAKREARYATASRALVAAGLNRSAISRELGVSTAILNRLEATYRNDVVLADNDPLLASSARLREQLGR